MAGWRISFSGRLRSRDEWPFPTSDFSLSKFNSMIHVIRMISRSPSPEFSPLAITEDLTPLPIYKAASTTSIDFSKLLDPPLQLHEDLKSGCGGQLWPAGMVLAQNMLRYHKNSLKDARMYVAILISLAYNIHD